MKDGLTRKEVIREAAYLLNNKGKGRVQSIIANAFTLGGNDWKTEFKSGDLKILGRTEFIGDKIRSQDVFHIEGSGDIKKKIHKEYLKAKQEAIA